MMHHDRIILKIVEGSMEHTQSKHNNDIGRVERGLELLIIYLIKEYSRRFPLRNSGE